MIAFPKREPFSSEEYLKFVRSLPCAGGDHPPPSQAHHYPPKGRRRDVDDTKTIPVCAWCHKRCHGEVVVGRLNMRMMPITDDDQQAACDRTFRRFFEEAPIEDVAIVFGEILGRRMRHRAQQQAVPR